MYRFGYYDISLEDSSRSYFHTALPKIMKEKKLDAIEPLVKILEDTRFAKAKEIRNHVIHNRTPS